MCISLKPLTHQFNLGELSFIIIVLLQKILHISCLYNSACPFLKIKYLLFGFRIICGPLSLSELVIDRFVSQRKMNLKSWPQTCTWGVFSANSFLTTPKYFCALTRGICKQTCFPEDQLATTTRSKRQQRRHFPGIRLEVLSERRLGYINSVEVW